MSVPERVSVSAPLVPAFDSLRLTVAPGEGIVARHPGVVALFAGSTEADQLGELLALCEAASDAGSRAPGRRLARQLAAWLAGIDDELPCLAVVAATDDSLAIFLTGPAVVSLPDGMQLTGAESAAWVDRMVDWPSGPITITVGGSAAAAADVTNLRSGVVSGGAATMLPGQPPDRAAAPIAASRTDAAPVESVAAPAPAAPAPAPAAPAQAPAAPAQAPAIDLPVAEEGMHRAVTAVPPPMPAVVGDPMPAEPEPPAQAVDAGAEPAVTELRAVLRPPSRSAQILGATSGEPPREPLPIPGTEHASAEPDVDAESQVPGFLCSRGHLNDPRALFCALCGIRMAERTGVLTIGKRPPLGLLVFDDGSTYTVDQGYVLGRDPDSDERVRQGRLRPLVIVDTRGAVSRRHAQIELDGWNVILTDIGSANGTFIAERGATSWSTLVAHQPVALRTSSRIRIGTRTFVFESPHGSS